MPRQDKFHWSLFIRESISLISQMMLALFFVRIALMLNDSYRNPTLAVVALLVAILFGVPLLVRMMDIWARILAAVREETAAIKLMKISIAIHKKLFGTNNTFLAEKEAILGETLLADGRKEEAKEHFEKSWQTYQNSSIKFQPLHPSMNEYLKMLNAGSASTVTKTGEQSSSQNTAALDPNDLTQQRPVGASKSEEENAAKLKTSLQSSKRFLFVQKSAAIVVTVPVIIFMLSVQALEKEIAFRNSNSQVLDAIKGINSLAMAQGALLGQYAASRTYADYALAFEESDNQISEMNWCADKALIALNKSGVRDDLLKVQLLNLKAKSQLSKDKKIEARTSLTEAIKISQNWKNDSAINQSFFARREREKALFGLAELERVEGNYAKAEPLFMTALGFENSNLNNWRGSVTESLELIDRLHKLQDIESRLGNKEKIIQIQKRICDLLAATERIQTDKNLNITELDFNVREAVRELDVCALMLAEAGKRTEAEQYRKRAEILRNKHDRNPNLNAEQQDSVVDACTRMTNELLAVKYRAKGWKGSVNRLLQSELRSQKARGAFERLPWYDADVAKKNGADLRMLEISMSPLSIRQSPDGSGLAVDVQGFVKIYEQKKEPEEQKFSFAYLMKNEKTKSPSIDDFVDNQPLAQTGLD